MASNWHLQAAVRIVKVIAATWKLLSITHCHSLLPNIPLNHLKADQRVYMGKAETHHSNEEALYIQTHDAPCAADARIGQASSKSRGCCTQHSTKRL